MPFRKEISTVPAPENTRIPRRRSSQRHAGFPRFAHATAFIHFNLPTPLRNPMNLTLPGCLASLFFFIWLMRAFVGESDSISLRE